MISRIFKLGLHSRGRRQKGQSLLIFGLILVVLIGAVGLAVDGALSYAYSVSLERAAAAAALAGVPYLPNNCTGSGADATSRAVAEGARNGFSIAPSDVSCNVVDRILTVTAHATVPTFFMAALGVQPFQITRTAKAGFQAPISLGQPGSQVGSDITALGTGGAFYFDRMKGWGLDRSEGDAYTPNPQESGAGGRLSTDVHAISELNSNEAAALAPGSCNSNGLQAFAASGISQLPCRGGYNWRVVVPSGLAQQVRVQVYNMAFAPDFGTKKNVCDNAQNLPAAKCNQNGYYYHEEDFGSHPCNGNGSPCAAASNYNAMAYTLLKVNDIFIRNTDQVMSQSLVYPLDATNYDGAGGGTGQGSAATPSYVNVKTNNPVTQTYAPSQNMQTYHSWADVANYTGSGDGGAVSHRDTGLHPAGTTLGAGTYRLRVDSLNYDGGFSPSGNNMTGRGSKGYAVRAVLADGSACPVNTCIVAGWSDMCVYTPIAGGGAGGTVPLFQLTQEYRGTTIDVDVFDLGDAGGDVNLSLINPETGAIFDTAFYPPATNVMILNNGISRVGTSYDHVIPQPPPPKPMGPADRGSFPLTQAGVQTATTAYTQEYQGSWIRITIVVPATYTPPASPGDYWKLKYVNSGGANDTFTFTVTARGGPVHLISS